MVECTRCIYDDSVPAITFNSDGICNYCKLYDEMDVQYPTGAVGISQLKKISDKIKKVQHRHVFDVIVGVSGGSDSCFMLHLVKELGLRPLVVNFDDGWNHPIAEKNLKQITDCMNMPLVVLNVDAQECNEIYRAFMWSGTPDLQAPADLAIAAALYKMADKHDIKYIFEGHNFRTEGVSPLGWLYMDGRYNKDILREFGLKPSKAFETYPNMNLWDMLHWTGIRRIRKIRPLYYIDIPKGKAKETLKTIYGWKDYGETHHENLFTKFYHTVYIPRRYGIDYRQIYLAAQVRAGYINKEEALIDANKAREMSEDEIELVRRKIGLSPSLFNHLLSPKHPYATYKDFKTYKQVFEWLRPLFWMLAKQELVPWSFYTKYTNRKEI